MAFPTVTVLDSFKRPNEAPLSNGGKWTKASWQKLIGVVGSESWSAADAFPDSDGAFWNVGQYGEPGVSVLLAKRPENAERYVMLWCCLKAPAAEKTGYCVRIVEEAGGKKGTFTLERWVAGVKTTLATKAAVAYDVGDSFGISVAAGKVVAWHKVGAGAWEAVAEAADATYTKGYVGMEGAGNLSRLQNFSAGTAVHEHTLSVSQGQSPQRQAAMVRALAIAQAQAITRRAAIFRTLPAVGQGQAVERTQIARALVLGQGQAVSRTAALFRHLSATGSSTPTATVRPGRAMTATQAATVVLSHDLSKVLLLAQEAVLTIEQRTSKEGITPLLTTDTSSTPSAIFQSTTEVRPLAEDEPALLLESTAV